MNKGLEEMNLLKSWLSNIYARAPGCPVIVVGTHYDKIHKSRRIEEVRQFKERLKCLETKPGKQRVIFILLLNKLNKNFDNC